MASARLWNGSLGFCSAEAANSLGTLTGCPHVLCCPMQVSTILWDNTKSSTSGDVLHLGTKSSSTTLTNQFHRAGKAAPTCRGHDCTLWFVKRPQLREIRTVPHSVSFAVPSAALLEMTCRVQRQSVHLRLQQAAMLQSVRPGAGGIESR